MPNELSTPTIKNLACLTSLRFFAAFAIVLQHLRGNFGISGDFANLPLDGAVSFFFVLSGFILVHVYPKLPSNAERNRFWISRIARIFPAHLICLALTALFVGDFTGIQSQLGYIIRILTNAFLIQSWYPDFRLIFSFNSVSWSISTEFFFYIIFPFLIYNFYKTAEIKLLLSTAILILIIYLIHIYNIPQYQSANVGTITSTGILYINPIVRIFEFILGMYSYKIWQKFSLYNFNLKYISTISEASSLFTILFVAYKYDHILAFVSVNISHYAAEWVAHSGLCFISAFLIISYANGSGMIGRFLSTQKFVFLGEISFSIYICHQLILRYIQINIPYSDFIQNQYMIIAYFLFVFAFSWQLWLIEKNAKSRIMKWYDVGTLRKSKA